MSNNNMVTVYSSEAQNAALLDSKTVPQADGLGVPSQLSMPGGMKQLKATQVFVVVFV